MASGAVLFLFNFFFWWYEAVIGIVLITTGSIYTYHYIRWKRLTGGNAGGIPDALIIHNTPNGLNQNANIQPPNPQPLATNPQLIIPQPLYPQATNPQLNKKR